MFIDQRATWATWASHHSPCSHLLTTGSPKFKTVFFHRYGSPTPQENTELPLAFKCSAFSTSRLFTLALFLSMQCCIICMCRLLIWEVSDSCWDSTTITDQRTKTMSWKCLKAASSWGDWYYWYFTVCHMLFCFTPLGWYIRTINFHNRPYISITLMLLKKLICN